MNILYVTHEFPFPAVAGHHLRTAEIISALPPGARVHLVGYSEKPCDPHARLPGIAGFDVVPALVRIRRRPFALAKALGKALLTHRPYSIAKYPVKAMQAPIDRHCRQSAPDVVITSVFTRHMVPPGPWKVILDVHNIEHALWQGFAPTLPAARAAFVRREARHLQRIEHQAWAGADGIIAICAEDAAIIGRASPGTPVGHVPVHIGGDHAPGRPAPFDVGMIGVWSWAPNAAAIADFARLAMPALAQAGLRVRIAGRGLDGETKARLTRWGADCPGHVPDIGDFYRSVAMIAAPYRLGGGVRMKVAEALGQGVPVIGTKLAFRGIGPGVPPGWIVEDVADLPAALIRHASDPPAVPPGLGAAHSRDRQRRAIRTLFRAAGVPGADAAPDHPAGPGSPGTKSTLFT